MYISHINSLEIVPNFKMDLIISENCREKTGRIRPNNYYFCPQASVDLSGSMSTV